MENPKVSVIILNYNGAQYLPPCLDALAKQTYPRDEFEVIVADNGSSDNSLALLRNEYSWVRIIENGANLGFSRGNNVAIQACQSDYVVLLNNDTEPESDWLQHLVRVAHDNPRAGLVTAHLQLFYDQLELTIKSDTFTPKGAPRPLGIQIFGVESSAPRGVVQYLDGFYGWESHSISGRFRWTKGQARIGIPVPKGEDSWDISFDLAAPRDLDKPVDVEIGFRGEAIAQWTIKGKKVERYHLQMPGSSRRFAQRLEQNTGSLVFRNGSGKDRGTYVKDNEMFFDVDRVQYASVEEVFAGCGASLLLRRTMLDEIGSLDDDFFMYYEDTDLSWRAWLCGWKVLYAPEARVRHIHCGTTQEWSSQFIYLTERNRLAMVYKNGAAGQVLRVWLGYFLKVLSLAWQALIKLVSFQTVWRQLASQVKTHGKIIITLLKWLPLLARKRKWIMSHRKVSPKDIESLFAEES